MSATCSSNRWMTSYIVTFLPHNGNPFTLDHSSQIQSVCLYHLGFNAGNKSSSKYCKDTRTQNLQNQLESLQEPTVGWNATKEAATSATVGGVVYLEVSAGDWVYEQVATSVIQGSGSYDQDVAAATLWCNHLSIFTKRETSLNHCYTNTSQFHDLACQEKIAGAAVQWPLFHFCLLNLTQIHLTACKAFWEI